MSAGLDEWTWITRAAAAVGIVLGVGNTIKLILDARRTSRERKREEAVKVHLKRLLDWFKDGEMAIEGQGLTGPGLEVMARPDDPFFEAIQLGMKLGLLKADCHEGRVFIRRTRKEDSGLPPPKHGVIG